MTRRPDRGGDPADAESVAVVNVGHGQTGSDDAGQGGDVGDLLQRRVVADLADQRIVA